MIQGKSKIYFASVNLDTGELTSPPIQLVIKRSAKWLTYGKVKFRVEWVK